MVKILGGRTLFWGLLFLAFFSLLCVALFAGDVPAKCATRDGAPLPLCEAKP